MLASRPCPKPGPHPRGRGIARNPAVVKAARRRDGCCLYGIFFKDGCVPGFDVAHIKGWGAGGLEADVLENVICLCRKHHNMHEAGEIADETLQGLLYQYYGYGPDPAVEPYLEAVKGLASDIGMTARFVLFEDVSWVEFTGNTTRCGFGIHNDLIASLSVEKFLPIVEDRLQMELRGGRP